MRKKIGVAHPLEVSTRDVSINTLFNHRAMIYRLFSIAVQKESGAHGNVNAPKHPGTSCSPEVGYGDQSNRTSRKAPIFAVFKRYEGLFDGLRLGHWVISSYVFSNFKMCYQRC